MMITMYHGIKTQIMTTWITMIWRRWWWKKDDDDKNSVDNDDDKNSVDNDDDKKSDSDDNDDAKKWQWWQWWCQKNACDDKVCSHSLRPPDWGILASSQLQLASTQSYSPSGIWRPSPSLPTSSTALNTFLCPQSVQLRHQRQNLTYKNKNLLVNLNQLLPFWSLPLKYLIKRFNVTNINDHPLPQPALVTDLTSEDSNECATPCPGGSSLIYYICDPIFIHSFLCHLRAPFCFNFLTSWPNDPLSG